MELTAVLCLENRTHTAPPESREAMPNLDWERGVNCLILDELIRIEQRSNQNQLATATRLVTNWATSPKGVGPRNDKDKYKRCG